MMVKPRLISISGSVHSGKTTVSRMLASQMPNAMYVDGDLISALVSRNYPEATTIDDMLPEVHERIIELVEKPLKNGLDVIVDYPFNDEVREQIMKALTGITFESRWFLLKPKIEKVLSGSVSRPELNDWEIERIKYHYSSALMQTSLAYMIDSTNLSPEETLKKIMEEL